ncbi:MAG: fumarylacetoacetate hydrolase family protein [Rhodospirillales bacterium]|nr:fumarylacetoacetate hydrolase family protein [Rhodospirillales bacterium]MBO6787348.1 fumarylacetoacetate hydrolase family protein [Rhodospirillales bacterium]
MPDIEKIGAQIWAARAEGRLLPRELVAEVAERNMSYKVQAAAAKAAGLTRAGWKIAATSEMAQELLGMDGPSIGPVFKEHLYQPGDTLPVHTAHGAAIECEIAFRMGDDLPDDHIVSFEDLMDATADAFIAVELVGCRFEGGFKDAGISVCISDFSFNGGLVVGPDIPGWMDMYLATVSAEVTVNGEKGNAGTGEAVLGNPAFALQWAATEAYTIGMPLKKGDVISTGTMTGVTPVKPGDELICDFGELGQIPLTFETA